MTRSRALTVGCDSADVSDYPTLSTPGQGLPAWTKANRAIQQSDVVLWYTTGMHHVVRTEDWPVMPVLWDSFELRRFDFFDRNLWDSLSEAAREAELQLVRGAAGGLGAAFRKALEFHVPTFRKPPYRYTN